MCGIAGHVASADAGRSPRDAHALVRAMADALAPPRPGRLRRSRQRARHARAHAPVDHRPVDRREPADARAATGRSCWSSTARSTTSASCAAELARAGVAFRTRPTPRCCCALYARHGVSMRRAAARHVRVRDLGRAAAAAGARARPAGQEAALLPRSASAGCRSRPSCRRCSPTATSSDASTPQAIHAYLTLGYVPRRDRRHRGRAEAGPGCIAVFEDGKLADERYWKLRFAPRTRRRKTSSRSCGTTVRGGEDCAWSSDVPLGAFLSRRHRFVARSSRS